MIRPMIALALAPALLFVAAPAQSAEWDMEKAHEQCHEFKTAGMAEEGVYGPWFKAMFDYYGWTDCNRINNDLGTNEVIAAYEAEKNNPQVVIADIGMISGPMAAEAGVTLKYTPVGSEFVPPEYREPGGGWIGSVVGAVGFVVNLEAVPYAPKTWADLLKPEFKGKINPRDPSGGGTGYMTFLAANQGLGGKPGDLTKAYDFFTEIRDNGNQYNGPCDIPNQERGECAIKFQYDFFGMSEGVAAMKKKGIKTAFIIPQDGSIWAPSALVANRYTDKVDLAKAILDFSMTDEAANAWASTYAHPLKAVFGGYKLPAELTADWPTEEEYKSVVSLTEFPDMDQVADEWEALN